MNGINIAIDLLWWRVGSLAGVASFTKNLLKGFSLYAPNCFSFLLLTAKDNKEYIESLELPSNFKICNFNTKSKNVIYTMFYQYFKIHKIAIKKEADLIYVPTPIYPLRKGKVPSVVTIHDLQYLHYPENASVVQQLKYKWCWKNAMKNANKIVAISDYVKQDLERNFSFQKQKIVRIYDPVIIDKKRKPFKELQPFYGIKRKKYFFTISSLLPHKNTYVILEFLKLFNEFENSRMKLVISGVGKKKHSELIKKAKSLSLSDGIVLTGYVTDSERNTLYENAYAFLFPSLFEGFGMPPIEALSLGTPVITTKCASIPEITKDKAIYVQNPRDPLEWYEKTKQLKKIEREKYEFDNYSLKRISTEYLSLFEEVANN